MIPSLKRLFDESGNEYDVNEIKGIDANCFSCTKKIHEKSAVLTSPPINQFSDGVDIIKKFHLCNDCFGRTMNFIMGVVNEIELPPKLALILESLEKNRMTTAMREVIELQELIKVHPMTVRGNGN